MYPKIPKITLNFWEVNVTHSGNFLKNQTYQCVHHILYFNSMPHFVFFISLQIFINENISGVFYKEKFYVQRYITSKKLFNYTKWDTEIKLILCWIIWRNQFFEKPITFVTLTVFMKLPFNDLQKNMFLRKDVLTFSLMFAADHASIIQIKRNVTLKINLYY